MFWPVRLTLARLRPLDAVAIFRVLIVAAVFGAFLWGDFVLFRRLFAATAQIEAATPFFALGLLRNLLAMVFLVASVVLMSSAMTAAIGAFFTDLDLDIYHVAPRGKLRVAVARLMKTFVQSAAVVFAFLVPLLVAFSRQYRVPASFLPLTLLNLLLLLAIPVLIASIVILLLVRWFPVQRVHQIVATIAILVLTAAVIAFRMSRPERFFADVNTDDVSRVLRAIDLPAMEVYPGTALATLMVDLAEGRSALPVPWQIAIPTAVLLVVFIAVARASYFPAFVRARESMAPTALASGQVTRLLDALLARATPHTRALVAKEVRILVRDVAQWSQVFLMGALLFIYLYNIRMLPLTGDTRAAVVAYANIAMAGFVVSAICLRFAYPSVSSEGKAFWLIRTAPISHTRLLWVKVGVFATPLVLLSVALTVVANTMLGASPLIWSATLGASVIISFTLVSLAVGMGALAPDFNAENPLQVGLSLGGFAYMAISLGYVGFVMFLMARPIVRYVFWRVLAIDDRGGKLSIFLPLVTGVTLSAALALFPLIAAARRLARASEK